MVLSIVLGLSSRERFESTILRVIVKWKKKKRKYAPVYVCDYK